jgi:glycosyltransferase involved in cell wall biosynthesis
MLEAMACGAPVLGSATPPVREILRDGENGFLFDFFDRERLVERATEIVGLEASRIDPVRQAARREIETRFSFRRNSLPAYMKLIDGIAAGT